MIFVTSKVYSSTFPFLVFYVKLSFVIVGKRWNFVPKRYRSPPREFKQLYGPEARQTTMDNFFKITKRVIPVVKCAKKEKIYVQSSIKKYLKRKRR